MAVTYVRNSNGTFEKVGPGSASTDTTLSQVGKPADAAAVGNALTGYSLLSHEHNYAAAEHEHNQYAASDSPTFTSSINMGRKANSTVGYDSVAIGRDCVASTDYCVAIGDTVSATNFGAFAVGTDNTASGIYSYAEGYQTSAGGYSSHTEGAYTETTGDYTHAEGLGTVASVTAQHVQGSYNIKDTESKYLHIVGNGETDTSRANAHTIDKQGNGWFAGDVYVGGTNQDDGNKVLTYDKLTKIFGAYYDLNTTITPGENYSSASGKATLVGNMLRVNFSATRTSAANGNIDNETVATFSVAHGGKITGGFAVSLGNGTSGHLANMLVASVACDDTNLTFKVTLTATGGDTSAVNPYFAIPVIIDIDKF